MLCTEIKNSYQKFHLRSAVANNKDVIKIIYTIIVRYSSLMRLNIGSVSTPRKNLRRVNGDTPIIEITKNQLNWTHCVLCVIIIPANQTTLRSLVYQLKIELME